MCLLRFGQFKDDVCYIWANKKEMSLLRFGQLIYDVGYILANINDGVPFIFWSI